MGSSRHLSAAACLTAATVTLAACAARLEPPVDVQSPRYPDYAVPLPPDGVGDPESRAELERAWRFLQVGNLQEAERALSEVVRRAPAFFPAETALGYTQLARTDTAGALTRFERVLEHAKGYVPALVGRGEALLAAGRSGEALAAFEAAMSVDPGLEAIRRRVEVLRFRVQRDTLASARKAVDAGEAATARAAYLQAIAASPGSAFLYRELAAFERKQGAIEAAQGYLLEAVELDPEDALSWVALGDLRETRGDIDGALAALTRAQGLEPGEAVAARIARLRRGVEMALMPPEFQAIGGTPQLTRADLAALIGVRLPSLVARAPVRPGVLITDARGHWARTWILAVVRAGIMEEYPNHTFRPRAMLRRADFAQAAGRVLDLVAAQLGGSPPWRGARPQITDLPPGHLGYPAAALVVAAEVMALDTDGAFRPSRPVTGEEALRAMTRLEDLAR
jgi:tetratricopeptide (TPR) repeat protein